MNVLDLDSIVSDCDESVITPLSSQNTPFYPADSKGRTKRINHTSERLS